jgi:hypothetical protein
VIEGAAGAAAALKMCYAAFTKMKMYRGRDSFFLAERTDQAWLSAMEDSLRPSAVEEKFRRRWGNLKAFVRKVSPEDGETLPMRRSGEAAQEERWIVANL